MEKGVSVEGEREIGFGTKKRGSEEKQGDFGTDKKRELRKEGKI